MSKPADVALKSKFIYSTYAIRGLFRETGPSSDGIPCLWNLSQHHRNHSKYVSAKDFFNLLPKHNTAADTYNNPFRPDRKTPIV